MKRWIGIILAVVLCAALLCVGVGASESDVIEIGTVDELAKIGRDGNYPLNGSYILTADIDLGGEDKPWTPIGTETRPFTGTFDGNGHTISGLYIDTTSNYQGLFGYVGELSNPTGTVKNLSVSGSVTAKDNVGGVVGQTYGGTVTNCRSDCDVTGNDYVGGVVGHNYGGSVENCFNTGNVIGEGSNVYIGGIVGYSSSHSTQGPKEAVVTNCYNTGKVNATGSSSRAGGIVGQNGDYALVTNCYNIGYVSGNGFAGGVAGLNNYDNSVTGCYYLESCVTSGGNRIGTSLSAEQFANKDNFKNGDTAWDFDNVWVMAVVADDEDGFTRPMLRGNLEDGAAVIIGDGTKEETAFEIPNLATLEYYAGLINEGKIYTVAGSNRYYSAACYKLTGDIDMNPGYKYDPESNTWTADGGEAVETPANNWTPIGGGYISFSGTFDGGNYTISGLYIKSSTSDLGLFGYNQGVVKNLIVSGSVTGTEHSGDVGGVVGRNSGTVTNCCYTGSVNLTDDNNAGGVVGNMSGGSVTNCYNTGSVTSNRDAVGGVVGHTSGGSVSNCYNTGSVSGSSNVGGVVGYNGSKCTVKNCYNTGSVSGSSDVGGVVGDNSGTVESCYNTGKVTGSNRVGGVVGQNDSGSVTGCCYLNTSAGTGIGNGSGTATGLTAAEFADSSKFVDWSFTDTWTMDVGLGRPVLTSCLETFEVTGDGLTEDTAFEIPNLATLEYFRNLINNKNTNRQYAGAYYLVTKDIDMSEQYGEGKESWTPIGTSSSNAFTGTFDGGNYTISGLYINEKVTSGTDSVHFGLFGYVRNGTLKNIKVESNINVDNSSQRTVFVGGIAGQTQVVFVKNCFNSGNIRGNGNVGGLFGMLIAGDIQDCSNTGDVTATGENSKVGGIAGNVSGPQVTNCHNTGNVTATAEAKGSNVGGLFGSTDKTFGAKGCHNEGAVTASGADSIVGGLVGANSGSIRFGCYNTGNVTADGTGSNVGGVVGYNHNSNSDDMLAQVNCCYNTGNVTANGNGSNVGGVVGSNYTKFTNFISEVSDCYNTGAVSSGDKSMIGGVVGKNDAGSVSNCYNKGAVGGAEQSYVGGVVGSHTSGTVTNCYYLDTSASKGIGGSGSGADGSAESKNSEKFASGEVAWLLKQGQSSQASMNWAQKLTDNDRNAYPVLWSGSTNRVYKVAFMDGDDEFAAGYANSGGTVALPNDSPIVDGKKFTGWFNSETGGTQVTEDIIVTADTKYYAQFVDETVSVEGVTLSSSNLTLEVGGKHTLTATVMPGDTGVSVT